MRADSLSKLLGSAIITWHMGWYKDCDFKVKSYELNKIVSIGIEMADQPNDDKVLSITFEYANGKSRTFKKMDDFSNSHIQIDGYESIQEYLLANEIQFL